LLARFFLFLPAFFPTGGLPPFMLDVDCIVVVVVVVCCCLLLSVVELLKCCQKRTTFQFFGLFELNAFRFKCI